MTACGRGLARRPVGRACSCASPPSSVVGSPSRSTSIADTSSSNSRSHALRPVTDFSVSTTSSGSVSRCGRYRRAERRWCAANDEPVVGEQLVDARVAQLGPLELEEQQLRADHRGALVDLLHARAARGIGRVGREVEAGEAPGPAEEVVDLGEPAHERDEPVGVELGDRAVRLRELVGFRLGGVEQLFEAGVVGRGQQRLEIPDDLVGGEVGRGHETGTYPPPDRRTGR